MNKINRVLTNFVFNTRGTRGVKCDKKGRRKHPEAASRVFRDTEPTPLKAC